MNLNPGLFTLGPNDLPLEVLPGSLDSTLPIIRNPGQRSTTQIAAALSQAIRTGQSPFVIASLRRELAIAQERERAEANTKLQNQPTTVVGPDGKPVIVTPSVGRDLVTFALLTAPAWGLLAAMRWMKPRRRAR